MRASGTAFATVGGEMPDNRQLQAALREYVAAHPDAADGLVGIRQWWLPEHLRYVSFAQLRAALTQMVERGEMRATPMLDGSELYARAVDRNL